MKSTGLNRSEKDKFYTKSSSVEKCKELVSRYVIIDKEKDLIIEPSAGNGAFVNMIKELADNYEFYDIEPDHPDVLEMNYLEFDYSDVVNKNYNKIHIIGNPPFGRQSTFAIKFIKKSCEFCDTLSFILPKSFKKEGMKKHFPLNFHLVCEEDLPKNSFTVNGLEHDVPTCFQIWEKRETDRDEPEKLIPKGFIFVKKSENPDISFRRVGVNAGKVTDEIENKSFQSHYFIKFTNGKELSWNLERVNGIMFCDNNTVGPKSISKQEVIFEFNNALMDA
jgi:hypothetical protein